MSSLRHTTIAAAAAAVAAFGLVAIAGAEAPAPPADTTITVSPRTTLVAPQNSPIDFPGVPSARRGKPLAKGYVAIGRDVRVTRGTETAFATMRMTCPTGRTWRTGGSSGDVAGSVLDRRVTGKRSVLVLAIAAPAIGSTATGTIYALCR